MIKLIIFVFLLVVTSTLLSTVFLIDDTRRARCENLILHANSSDKVSYLKNWLDQNLQNEELLERIGYSGHLRSGEDEELFSLLAINWKLFEIDDEFAFISLNGLQKDRDGFLEPKNIKSVSFGHVRDSIIIKINDSGELGIPGIDKFKHKLIKINNEVEVYCD